MGVSDITGLLGQYAHGNEPSHHMAYLYSYVGQPWKTQHYTRELLDVMYDPVPEGIIGNEDAGSVLSVDGVKVVDNDGGHSAITAIGRVALEAGLHSFRFLYFEDYEGQELGWSWRSPGGEELSPIPTDLLYINL